jgi:hypothetical protein
MRPVRRWPACVSGSFGLAICAAALAAAAVAPRRARAQSNPGAPPTLHLGLGVGLGWTEVLGVTRTGSGVAGTFQIGAPIGRHLEMCVDATGHAFRVWNPQRQEAFRAVYIMPMLGWRGHRLRIDGGLGGVAYFFSGPNVWASVDGGFAVGATGAWRPDPEGASSLEVGAFVRAGVTTDGELSSQLLGLAAILKVGGRPGR